MKNNYLIAVDLNGTLVYEFKNKDDKSLALLKKLGKNNYFMCYK